MKGILVRAKVVPLEKQKGCCRSCGGTRGKICKHLKTTETFKFFSTKKQYCIKPDSLNFFFQHCCVSFSCKACSKQYTGSTEKFWSRFSNYKSAHRNIINGNTVIQASFHAHFVNDKYNGMSDWKTTLID